jgi:hypothetical protein
MKYFNDVERVRQCHEIVTDDVGCGTVATVPLFGRCSLCLNVPSLPAAVMLTTVIRDRCVCVDLISWYNCFTFATMK